MKRTGPHAQWLIDLTFDEMNALRLEMGYRALKPDEFKGVYRTADDRDADKAAGAKYRAENPDG